MKHVPTVETLAFRISYLFSMLSAAVLNELYERGARLWLDAEEVELFLTTASDPHGYPSADNFVSIEIQLDRHELDVRMDADGSAREATSPPSADWIRQQLLYRAAECANALHVKVEAAAPFVLPELQSSSPTSSMGHATSIEDLESGAASLFRALSAPVLSEVYQGGARLWFDIEEDEMFLTTASDPGGYPQAGDLVSIDIEVVRSGQCTGFGGGSIALTEISTPAADWVRQQLICQARECANALYFKVEAAEAA